LVFPPRDEEDKYVVLPYFWLPEETLDLRVRRDHVPYDVWRSRTSSRRRKVMSSTTVSLRSSSRTWVSATNIREIAFDRWGAVQMVQNLEGMGFTVVPLRPGL
jgi:phage terminase large subunit-like protein